MKLSTLGQGARRTAGELSDSWSTHEHDEEPTPDQRAALNAWEDEGGRTATAAKAAAIQEPS
jgi:hypothetical protein